MNRNYSCAACGGTDHKKSTSSRCKARKKDAAGETDSSDEETNSKHPGKYGCPECGGTDHRKATSSKCPLRKNRKKVEAETSSESSDDSMTKKGPRVAKSKFYGCSKCGGTDHRRSSSSRCPLNKKRKVTGDSSSDNESGNSDCDDTRNVTRRKKSGKNYNKKSTRSRRSSSPLTVSEKSVDGSLKKYEFKREDDGELFCPLLDEKENREMLNKIDQNLKETALYFSQVSKLLSREFFGKRKKPATKKN